MAKETGTIYHRVIGLPEPLRQAMQMGRDAKGVTNAAFVAQAVADHLHRLVEGLQSIGFAKLQGKRRPARLPFSKEAETLRALRDASDLLAQVPASTLLLLCLAAATAEQPPKPKRRGRPKKETSDAERTATQPDACAESTLVG